MKPTIRFQPIDPPPPTGPLLLCIAVDVAVVYCAIAEEALAGFFLSLLGMNVAYVFGQGAFRRFLFTVGFSAWGLYLHPGDPTFIRIAACGVLLIAMAFFMTWGDSE